MDNLFTLKGSLRRPNSQCGPAPVVRGLETVLHIYDQAQVIEPTHRTEEEWFQPASGEAAPAEPPLIQSIDENPDQPQAIYAGLSRVVEYFQRGSTGMSVKLDILGLDTTSPHPFRGIKAGSTNGQRVKLMVCTAAEDDSPIKPVYNGEAIVIWWAEDTRGVHVSFKLDDGIDGYKNHPFKDFEVGENGQLMTLGCWPITDTEVIVTTKPKLAFNRMSAVQQSQILCQHDEEFQSFCGSIAESLNIDADPNTPARILAAEVVYAFCKITSRAQLTKNAEARERWDALLKEFNRTAGPRAYRRN